MFTSYGNKKVHPDINEMIVRAFLNRNKLSATQTILPAFKKYNFTFDIDRQCKGVAVIKDGFFHTEDVVGLSNSMGDNIHYHGANILDLGAVLLTDEEGDAEMSTTQWIAHGGFAAAPGRARVFQ